MFTKLTYKHTLWASYIGYITQAIVNNLPPLFFVIFHENFGLSEGQLGLLITINFCVQIAVDFISIKVLDRIGYRAAAVIAHICCTVGLVGLGLFPAILPGGWSYAGFMFAMGIMAIGGGTNEVLISPIVEALPSESKSSSMSFLHAFYSWGQVGVVALTTVYFLAFGDGNWYVLPALWAIVPFVGLLLFTKVPILQLNAESEDMPLRSLIFRRAFAMFLILMLCAGASEMSTSQWASFFAEAGLSLPKAIGDMIGPCFFALTMGLARTYFGTRKNGYNIRNVLLWSSILCVASYLVTVFSPWPLVSLISCGLCGFTVAQMWPGVYSLASKTFPRGGTAMFALLAFAGDMGCASSPSLVGYISTGIQNAGKAFTQSWFPNMDLQNIGLRTGMFIATIFPIVMFLTMLVFKKIIKKKNSLGGNNV